MGRETFMDRIRVATLQYFIRPVASFEEFAAQVAGLVETAADYKAHLVVFPEYFTIQLLTLGDLQRPLKEQVRSLSRMRPRFVDLMGDLARKSGLYLVAGSIPTTDEDDGGPSLYNDCYVFSPTGEHAVQGKMHMTRWESEDWHVSPRDGLVVFETAFGRMGVNICYDVEFPELARAAARQDCHVLVVPSCTDERQGYLRVRYCAQARAIENSMYVILASTVGSLPMVPAVSLNYGQASILTPSDFAFARDGVLAEGVVNQETMVIGDLNLDTIRRSRTEATVLPLRDSVRSQTVVQNSQVVAL